MKIGCVKEIKNNEYRVGLTPDNVKAYVAAGHDVYMEKGAGVGSGFSDNEYVEAGASLIEKAEDVWNMVDMMVKVKEPLPEGSPLPVDHIAHQEADESILRFSDYEELLSLIKKI